MPVIVPDFDPVTHTYTVDGRIVPGVTGLLKELGLYPPYPGGDEYTARGTAVHRVTELLDAGRLDEQAFFGAAENAELLPYVHAYQRFIADVRPRIIAIESRLYSSTLDLAGTLDRIIQIGGVKGILDLKCTESVAPATEWQLAMYSLITADGAPKSDIGRWALQLSRTGKYRLRRYSDDSKLFVARSRVRQYHRERTAA